jgi:hypothetical protein
MLRRSLGKSEFTVDPRKIKVNNAGWAIPQFRVESILRPHRKNAKTPLFRRPGRPAGWKGRVLLSVLLSSVLLSSPATGSFAASGAKGGQETGDVKVDYKSARRDIQNVEVAINTIIAATFPGPYAVVQNARGVHLPGYGFMFTFLVNIHRAVINTPFGEVRNKNITPEEKKRRIEELKDKLVRMLLENGDTLRQLRKDESVSVVVFVEDRNFPGDENQNKTMILRAFKRDLDELAHKENRWKELKQRMEIIEY